MVENHWMQSDTKMVHDRTASAQKSVGKQVGKMKVLETSAEV